MRYLFFTLASTFTCHSLYTRVHSDHKKKRSFAYKTGRNLNEFCYPLFDVYSEKNISPLNTDRYFFDPLKQYYGKYW